MEAFQIGIKNLPVDKYCAVKAVDRPGIAGKLQQLLVRKAVYNLCLLVTQELAAQLAKLVGDFFHGFDRLVVGFHKFILRFCNCLTEVGRRSKQKEHFSDNSKKCSYSFVQALCVFI